ncbi:hypothetical protein N7456_001305 [Penicillium angulare]|uniref:Uncharacterized protein n=1 Tax=Penicillium angulare TaxID=116970 RepID=A0A9W9KRR5_9EURO|nr:hypothetical protein N7456_001305 [Penicillium angulare]
MAPYQTVHLPPATQSDGLPEPTTSFVNLPDIPKLTFDSEIVEWASEIKSALNFLGLDNLIDPSKPRSPSDPSSPKSTQPLPLAWRFWSLTIRDWLFDQLGNEIQDLVNQLPTRPTYADDLWREIDQLHVRDPEEAARKATLTLFTMRRADYPSALEYVSRWQIQNGINRSRKVNVSPYMSIVIMLSQVEDELPKAAAFIRGQLAEKGVDAMSMEFSESERIGALLMLEASKLLDKTPPLPEVSESPFTKTINKFTDTENKTKEDSTNSKGMPQETSKTCGPQKEIHEDEMESKTEEDPKELAQKSPEPLASRIEFCQTEMAERQTNERSNGLPYERSVAHVA